MNIPEILPCPFCGTTPNVLTDRSDEHSEWVSCSNSECSIYADGMTHEQWNRRQPTPEAVVTINQDVSGLRDIPVWELRTLMGSRFWESDADRHLVNTLIERCQRGELSNG